MELAETIKQFYFSRFSELPRDKQFHFASRLAAWQNDPQAISELERLAAYMVPDKSDLKPLLQAILDSQPSRPYAYELRRPYFQKYPGLFGIHNAMFRVRHLKEFYGIDARQQLIELAGREVMERIYNGLRADPDAIRLLSRFAVDYLFLYEILFEKPRQFDPRELTAIADGYDSKDIVQSHLFIYLFTHAIIADSNFYARAVPSDRIGLYQVMLHKLEAVLDDGRKFKLDNQFELLVAARICGIDSGLSDKINQAARQSLDTSGNFIVDSFNGPPNTYLNSFSGSEHRNVLYIMSTSPYKLSPSLK